MVKSLVSVGNRVIVFLGYCTPLDLRNFLSSPSRTELAFQTAPLSLRLISRHFGEQPREDLEEFPVYGGWKYNPEEQYTFTFYILIHPSYRFKIGAQFGITRERLQWMKDTVIVWTLKQMPSPKWGEQWGNTLESTLPKRMREVWARFPITQVEYGEGGIYPRRRPLYSKSAPMRRRDLIGFYLSRMIKPDGIPRIKTLTLFLEALWGGKI